MSLTAIRFRFLLLGVLAAVVLAGGLVSSAGATNQGSGTDQDGGTSSLQEALDRLGGGNPLRKWSLGDQEWEVWFCEFRYGRYDLDFDLVAQALHNKITPFFEWLSGGHYRPTFVEGKTVQATGYGFSDCEAPVIEAIEEGGSQQGRPMLIIGNDFRTDSYGILGLGAFVSATYVHPWTTGWEQWLSSEHENWQKFPPSWSHAVGRMARVLGFARTDETIFGSNNEMDFMSLSGDLMGTSAINRYAAGWIAPEDVIIHEQGSDTYTLSPVGVEGEQMLVIPHHSGDPDAFYTLGARVSQEYEVGHIPPEGGVEVYLVYQRDGSPYAVDRAPTWTGPSDRTHDWIDPWHWLGVGDSVDLGRVRVEVTEQ